MTITPTTPTTPTTRTAEPSVEAAHPYRPVALDLYKDIHKGIRADLFDLTLEAGRIDPGDRDRRDALADHVRRSVTLLMDHAEHEDGHIQPALEAHRPELAAAIASDHEVIDARLPGLVALADDALAATEPRWALHRLHLELADFTATYLRHEDLEERVVMPALEVAIGVEAVGGIHEAIVGSIPPEQMAASLGLMLPVMNLDDRTELLGGMQAGAPPEVFEGVWQLTGSVLEPRDVAALGRRLGR
jgi:hypothetical protein